MESIIDVRGLSKRFGDIQAVASVDFDVRAGEVFGFLGPNGAGKTTTINILTGLARADAGSIRALLPGVMAVSVLFGTTSLLAVTVTFEKRGRSFERLLLAPIPLELLMLAKTTGAILFGTANAFVPVAMAAFLADLSGVNWAALVPAVVLIAVSSTFLGLFIAVSVSEVFEAQTFSNFFRFPMLFLCGLFFPVASLPIWLRPLSYALPLTYGADLLHASISGTGRMPAALDFGLLTAFCAVLFALSLWNIRRRWIA